MRGHRQSLEEAAGPQAVKHARAMVTATVPLRDVATEQQRTSASAQRSNSATEQQRNGATAQPAARKSPGQGSAEARKGTRRKPYKRSDGKETCPFQVSINIEVIDLVDDYLRPQVRRRGITMAEWVEYVLARAVEERWFPEQPLSEVATEQQRNGATEHD
jgi:hypothetical protein